MKEKITLCGDNCIECPRYNAHTDDELKAVAELWYKIGWRDSVVKNEEIACSGCHSHKKCTYQLVECTKEHNVSRCNLCDEFPCTKITDMLKRSDEYKIKCKEVCTEREYIALEKAFFNKEKNLKKHRRDNMILRDYKKEDSAVICKWLRSEAEFYRWSADRFNKFPMQDNDIEEHYAPQIETKRFIPLTAVDDEGNPIGHFIIRYPTDDSSSVRFGFIVLNPELRGQGNGKKMLRLGIEYAKEHLDVKRIDLGVFANNDSARHCYESVGFKEYGRRNCEMPIGTWECIDMELYVK